MTMTADKVKAARTAIVTGASSGIGLEFCRQLAADGWQLVMVSERDGELRAAAADIAMRHNVTTYPVTLDLTGPAAAAELEAFVDNRGLRPSVLVNNAGIFSFCPVTEMSERRLCCFVDLHVRAVTMLSRAFGERFARQGHGYILNMSSMSCWAPMPGIGPYSATKAYIRVLSRSMHCELRDRGVGVTVACPGGIATDLFGLPPRLRRLAVRIGALDTPERFAAKALRRMFRRRQQYINGLLNRIAIVAVGITPRATRMLVKRLMLDRGIRR